MSARAFFLHQHHHHHHHHHQPDSCVFLSIIIQHFGHSNVAIVINVRCIISYVVCVRVYLWCTWECEHEIWATGWRMVMVSYNALLYYRCSVYASHTRPRARLRTNEMCVWFLFDNNKRSQSATSRIRQCAIIKMLENEQNNLYIFIWFVFFVYIIIYTEKNYDLKIQIWKYCRSFSCLCMFEYPKQRFTAHSFTVFLNFFFYIDRRLGLSYLNAGKVQFSWVYRMCRYVWFCARIPWVHFAEWTNHLNCISIIIIDNTCRNEWWQP